MKQILYSHVLARVYYGDSPNNKKVRTTAFLQISLLYPFLEWSPCTKFSAASWNAEKTSSIKYIHFLKTEDFIFIH
jgi:hypothetical protein